MLLYKTDMPLVSVIIPTFNRREMILRAVNSVEAQTFRDWELLVVDDGSHDGTEELFVNHPFARYLRLESNHGVSQARNIGVAETTAPWIAFLDSDDEWLRDKLQRQLLLKSTFSLIHGEEIWLRKGVRVNPMKKHAKSGGRIFSRCVDLCCISPSTVLLRRDLFLKLDGFDPAFPVCEDYALWLKACAEHEVGFVTEPVIKKYGGHPDQLSAREPAMDYWRVRALIPFLHSSRLSQDERLHVAATIEKKSEILLNGYRKYASYKNQTEVEDWLLAARKVLTQAQSAHSAAERFPRSLASDVL